MFCFVVANNTNQHYFTLVTRFPHSNEIRVHASRRTIRIDTNILDVYKRQGYDWLTAVFARHPNLHTYVAMQSIRAKEKGELLALDVLGPLP